MTEPYTGRTDTCELGCGYAAIFDTRRCLPCTPSIGRFYTHDETTEQQQPPFGKPVGFDEPAPHGWLGRAIDRIFR
ncbi:MAG TPA: hypothetical protein VJT49_14740 [Amycolatopsis sp.]|uniref:hypothetical protein n=1 Tax=Amycolatopsis sp. TaxID=37632 RepID=UPI002B491724|nr:hypothetical protein [Amycolatopsis sp.]HKS46335.1 hypothetical protein [Amycolatopsis sp.]